MDLTYVLLATIIGGCAWTLMRLRADRSVEREEEVTIVENLSERAKEGRSFLSYFDPNSMPIVLPETDGLSAPTDNILVSCEYPLIPFHVRGPWIPPGTTVTVMVRTNSAGDVISIFAR